MSKFNSIACAKKCFWFVSDEKLLQWWPAWWMMRLKVTSLENNWRKVRITLPLTWVSKNAGGGMFGGYQASLADPIAPLACGKVFSDYQVWTRKLSVDFRHPGNTDLELRFDFSPEKEQEIHEELVRRGRCTPIFEYGLYRADGVMCTHVECVVAIRQKGYMSSSA